MIGAFFFFFLLIRSIPVKNPLPKRGSDPFKGEWVSLKLDNSPRAGGAKLDRLSHDIRVMTVLQGPVLYLHFPLTYKTELFSKKVQKVVQNGVQKRGPPDELCNAQILVFACFFSVSEFRDTEFCQSTAGCIDASGRQMPVHKINKNCHNNTHTQTHQFSSMGPT